MKETWPKAAQILAAGGTAAEAAKAAQVTERTIRNWRADEPQFADAVDDYRGQMLAEASGVLAAHTAAAAQRLADIATDGEIPLRHQLRAALGVLDYAARYRESQALEARLRALEIAAGLRPESW